MQDLRVTPLLLRRFITIYYGWKCLERTRWNMFYNIKKVVLFLKLVTSLLLVRNYGNNYNTILQNFNKKMNEKRSQEYKSMDLEYLTGLLRRFWFFDFDSCTASKILICFSLIKHFSPTTTTGILAICKCRYGIKWLLQKFT